MDVEYIVVFLCFRQICKYFENIFFRVLFLRISGEFLAEIKFLLLFVYWGNAKWLYNFVLRISGSMKIQKFQLKLVLNITSSE